MSTVIDALRSQLTASRVVTDPDVMEQYRHDRALTATAGKPSAVVRAQSIGDVVATMQVASATHTPVVTRGAGTGLAGGANAIDGCIVLSTAAMNRILDIDVAQRIATVEPGVLNGDLAAAVAEHGLWYAPDPSSRAICSIGGNVATNAGGACCVKYGVTGDHVAALKAVLADGSIIETGSACRKNVAGLDLTKILIGSEGTLAVIVEVAVRLRPAPRPPATLVAAFPTPEAAGEAVLAIDKVGEFSLVELMDRTTINAVEDFLRMGLDRSAGALLVVQSDGARAGNDVAAAEAACAATGASYAATTVDVEEGAAILHARHSAIPALERSGATLLDDVGVPKPRLAELITRVEAIAAARGVTIATFGHAGDGNLHPTVVYDPADAAAFEAARAAFGDILDVALELGGTISGEHGVGQIKLPWLARQVGSNERALMEGIRKVFDPHEILNPGKAT
ncbi:MAG TPA: FAD-linked oxidase C-terminal domain-containing protein [Acidimicrobiales bacterium]|nr:FAD-linked oxidase C-terminal domain-containing protein [Acidimicrobiales bacterium]